jgi:hypothetical protein
MVIMPQIEEQVLLRVQNSVSLHMIMQFPRSILLYDLDLWRQILNNRLLFGRPPVHEQVRPILIGPVFQQTQ